MDCSLSHHLRGIRTKKSVSYGKKPHLWIVVLVAWISSIVVIQRPIIEVFLRPLSLWQYWSLAWFLAWIDFAWLYGIYQLCLVLFARRACKNRLSRPRLIPDKLPSVAILYTTMNDFSEAAALSCVRQEYPRFHVFLLDDSTEERYKRQIDACHDIYPDKTTVIRRESREGFKAGNLNHALELIASRYEFFAVCDADGILPPEFVMKTLPHFSDNDRIAFVQSIQSTVMTRPESSFASVMGVSVDTYWRWIASTCDDFGFVMFHGHGGIIRTRVWSQVGGFPPVVAEDLAFSTRVRERGYVGIIADDVICGEEFPSTYSAFVKRELKYTRATCEHMLKYMWSFLCSKQITWFEKIDRLLNTMAMTSTVSFLLFLLVFTLVLPSIFNIGTVHNSFTNGLAITGNSCLPLPRLFLLMTTITLMAPLMSTICNLWRHPSKLLRHIVISTSTHLSLVLPKARNLLQMLISGRNYFPVTGAQGLEERDGSWLNRRKIIGIPELFFTILFTGVAIVGGNLAVLVIPLSACAGLAALKWPWEHRFVRKLFLLPFIAVIILILLNMISAVGLGGVLTAAVAGY